MGEVLSGGAAPFFNSTILVSSPELSPNPPGEAENENVCGANRYSVGWCGSECHSVQLGGGTIVKAPKCLNIYHAAGHCEYLCVKALLKQAESLCKMVRST